MLLRRTLKSLHREALEHGEAYLIEVIAASAVHPPDYLIDSDVLGDIKARYFGDSRNLVAGGD